MKLREIVLECIYPGRCPVCHDIVMPKGLLLCKGCEQKLQFLVQPRCKRCSKMLLDEQEEYCFDCRRRHHRYDEGFSIFPYDALMQRSMIYFKFHGRREYGKFYGEMILRCARQTVARWNPEVLIPVPIHRSKRRQRGYNQSEIIGGVLSKGFSIPIRSDLVKRVKSTKAQKELNNRERKRNLQGAFTAANEISRYRRVLLVDDIYTTGSTVDELAGVLKKHGVEQVFFVTVCIGKGY